MQKLRVAKASTTFDTLHLLQGSTELFPAMVAAIDAAQHSVQLETYIFDTTASGAEVACALERAGQRGVTVRLVVDGFGTPKLTAEWSRRFQSAGVQVLVFEPIVTFGFFFLPSQWRRLHRKLCIVDDNLAFCGGINILDDFHDPNHGQLAAPRFDFSIRVTGKIVASMQEVTSKLWANLIAQHHGIKKVPERMLAALESFSNQNIFTNYKTTYHSQYSANSYKTGTAYLVLRDNVRNRSAIERAYLHAIGDARSHIIIANAYFLPGKKLRRALIHAARRGVKVQLLLQGRYEYFLQYHAIRPVYGALLSQGIEIYEYTPSYLHAKVAVVDDVWATVGSSNLDPLSLLLAREANIVAHDAPFAKQLRARLEQSILHQSQRVEPEALAKRPWSQRVRDRIAYIFMRTGLWFLSKRY